MTVSAALQSFGCSSALVHRKMRILRFVIGWLITLVPLLPLTCSAEDQPTYTQAEALVRKGQLDQGIALARQILESDAKNLKALNLLGIALTSKGDLDEANRQYRKAIELNPSFYHALKNLAINELAQKNVAGAKRDLTAALKFAPADPAINAYLGRIAYAQQDYPATVAHLSKLDVSKDAELASELADSELRLHPVGGPGARPTESSTMEILNRFTPADFTDRQQFRIGLALAGHEQFQDAIPYFQAVSTTHPESYDAAFNLAVCLVEAKQFPPAIAVLRSAADHGHKSAELDNLLAEAYEGNNQTQEAIDTLREATRLAPEDEDNFIDLADLCTKYEAFKIALDVIEVGLHYHPESDRLIFQRGVVYAMTNKFDLAEQDFQTAARFTPEKNLSYVAMGISFMQAGNLPKAVAELRGRIRNKPNDALLQYLLGEALTRSGATPGTAQFLEAKVALQRSVRLNAKFAPSHVDLAKLYIKENQLDAAIQHLETARRLDPKDTTAYAQLAIAYRRKGKPEMASAMLAALNRINEEERAQISHRTHLHAEAETPAAQEGP
jgi:Flp pilus assembly protein TadD